MDKGTTQLLKICMMQQGEKPVDKHVQDFEKAALEAGYDGYPLVVKFKRSLNQGLQRCLTELQPMPITIEQWYCYGTGFYYYLFFFLFFILSNLYSL